MVKPISEYTKEELEEKIMKIKAERERTAEALKKYEEELERQRLEGPLGAPIDGAISRSFLLWFPSKKSADKFDNEYFHNFIKALQDIANGNPIDIQVLSPLLKKGYVAMDKDEAWYWCEDKPELYEGEGMWKDAKLFYSLFAFNIKPTEDWRESLMECGL